MGSLFIGTVLLCIASVSCSGFGDPCTIEPMWWGSKTNTNIDLHNNTLDETVKPGCENGSIWWTAPWGYLRLHFGNSHPGSEFRVCLSGNMVTNYQSVMDISGGRNRKMSVEGDEHKMCSSSRSDKVTILLQAPPGMYYVVINDYAVEYQE